jgi:2,3-bisphosphoglycerate-independent phosphoglycerate mutase
MDRFEARPEKISLGAAVRRAYAAGQEDEALEPIIRASSSGLPIGLLGRGDGVIFYDIRGEREIELTRSLTDPEFPYFPRPESLELDFVTMISYDRGLRAAVAFPPEEKIQNTLTEAVSRAGLRTAKIAESEKAVHVGYFLNGKSDELFPGESRFITPSPEGVTSYARTPEMSAAKVVEQVAATLRDPGFRMIIVNLANVDVVGHIEDRGAVLRAVETVDESLGRIAAECRDRGAALVVTSDHGTVEEWHYPDGTVNTGHTKNPVPFILADFARPASPWVLRETGELADVAPTVLRLLGITPPAEMTGRSLIEVLDGPRDPAGAVVLLILDGWGLRPADAGNLIAAARTPHFDALWREAPHSVLLSSGEAVGMPAGTVGNSEAGHLHLGAGRRLLSDRLRIDQSIGDGSFFANSALAAAMEKAKTSGRALHLLGIVSHYSSHGTLEHLFALLEMARRKGLNKVFLHALIGRRGEKPESGAIYVEKVIERTRETGVGELATVIGRFWALDREANWDRVEKCYRALVEGRGTLVTD